MSSGEFANALTWLGFPYDREKLQAMCVVDGSRDENLSRQGLLGRESELICFLAQMMPNNPSQCQDFHRRSDVDGDGQLSEGEFIACLRKVMDEEMLISGCKSEINVTRWGGRCRWDLNEAVLCFLALCAEASRSILEESWSLHRPASASRGIVMASKGRR